MNALAAERRIGVAGEEEEEEEGEEPLMFFFSSTFSSSLAGLVASWMRAAVLVLSLLAALLGEGGMEGLGGEGLHLWILGALAHTFVFPFEKTKIQAASFHPPLPVYSEYALGSAHATFLVLSRRSYVNLPQTRKALRVSFPSHRRPGR